MKYLILIAVLLAFFTFLFYAYKALVAKYRNQEKDEEEGKPKNKNLVYLSRRGSILFYIFLL